MQVTLLVFLLVFLEGKKGFKKCFRGAWDVGLKFSCLILVFSFVMLFHGLGRVL